MGDAAAASDLGTMPEGGQPGGEASSSSSAPVSIHNFDILGRINFRLDFDADNYVEWRDAMLSALDEFGARDHVVQEEEEEEEHDWFRSGSDADDEWRRADASVVLWIYGTISDEVLDDVTAAPIAARELWAQLRGFFTYDAVQEFRAVAQGDMAAGAYGWRLKALADAVADAGGEPVSDRLLTMQLLRGVGPGLRVMGTSLLAHDPLPTFSEACSWLCLEEYRRDELGEI